MNDQKDNVDGGTQPPQSGGRIKRPPGRDDTYFEKLLKYIPADIMAAFVAIDAICRDNPDNPLWLSWVVFGGLLVLTPLYAVLRPTEPPPPSLFTRRAFHAIAATVCFSAWVFALGGPFAATWPEHYRPVYGGVLLIFTTLLIPIVEKLLLGETGPARQRGQPDRRDES